MWGDSSGPRNSSVELPFCFFVVNLNKLLNKQFSCWWYEMRLYSCGITVMLWSSSIPKSSLSLFELMIINKSDDQSYSYFKHSYISLFLNWKWKKSMEIVEMSQNKKFDNLFTTKIIQYGTYIKKKLILMLVRKQHLYIESGPRFFLVFCYNLLGTMIRFVW